MAQINDLSFNPSNGLIMNTKTGKTYTSKYNDYIRIQIGPNIFTSAHRLMWEHFFGEIPMGMVVDHINGIKNDNRIENLRIATYTENARNRKKANSNNRCGAAVPGVSWSKHVGKYRVTIYKDGKQMTFGFFKDLDEAEDVAIIARRELYTEYAGY